MMDDGGFLEKDIRYLIIDCCLEAKMVSVTGKR